MYIKPQHFVHLRLPFYSQVVTIHTIWFQRRDYHIQFEVKFSQHWLYEIKLYTRFYMNNIGDQNEMSSQGAKYEMKMETWILVNEVVWNASSI